MTSDVIGVRPGRDAGAFLWNVPAASVVAMRRPDHAALCREEDAAIARAEGSHQ